jgi:hypothetical protein
VKWLHLERDGLAIVHLHENLHAPVKEQG